MGNEQPKSNLIYYLRNAWRGIGLSGRNTKLSALRPDLPDADRDLLREQMGECLEGKGGEVSARGRAAALGQAYLQLNDTGRRRFLETLSDDFAMDRQALREVAHNIAASDDAERQSELEVELRRVLKPQRLTLLTQFNSLPRGIQFLVDLRTDLLRFKSSGSTLDGLDRDLRGLLRSWFDVGFLELQRITWDAPASLLEKLMLYEAVHRIRSWDDLRNRLESDRRCYGFFHPHMPDEPLIFVQVALVESMSDNVQVLLDENAPTIDAEAARAAIFYSITNTQNGLSGVSFGGFLIKRVVDDLARDLPGVKTFATLSPVPGLRKFLDTQLENDVTIISAAEQKSFADAADGRTLSAVLDEPDWHQDESLAATLQAPITRQCVKYLALEKLHDRAIDPVTHFHITNGARLDRINWLADTSSKGLRQSAGIMVNYLYKLADIERNHELYQETGEVPLSPGIKAIAKKIE